MVGTMAKIDDSVKKKVPELRFKGFTDDWEERKFKDILKTHSFRSYLAGVSENGEYEVIQQGDKPIVGYSDGEPFTDYKDVTLFGDHTVSLYKPKSPFFVATDGVKILSADNFEGNYLYTTLERYKPEPQGYKRHFTILKNQDVWFTENMEEQQKIGSFFKQLDDTIALHQRKLDLLKEQKKGYLQKMFPKNGAKVPELRFAGFADDWEERKLGDEVKINGRIGFRGYTQADIVTKETGVLAYSPTNIVNNRLYRKQSDTYITKQKYRESPEIMVKNSDILFVKTGSTLGKSALVQGINYHATVNPQIVIIRSNELDEYFLSVILTSYNILKRINTIKIGGAIPTMTETELKKFPIQVPKSTEQKKIGSFFKQLDNTIALHQRKLDLLKEQKKGFLQKMFV
ncbi:restriction endonuclease subunit S [Lactococcus petauri]|uniref:restriction endonuclease subunit S n=1 Tax=Lactococcus petauri TaxID=1940789 RepID=UPI0022E57C60|nr:restriction endonuclease subunit S [Lactococcus petauri]